MAKIPSAKSPKSTTIRNYFLFGIRDPASHMAGRTIQSGRPPSIAEDLTPPTAIATELMELPLLSPDRSTVALIIVDQTSTVSNLDVILIDAMKGTISPHHRLVLPALSGETQVLTTSCFSTDSATLAIVLSIMVPTNQRMATKIHPRTRQTVVVPQVTWVVHHSIIYFNRISTSFAGPYDLDDAPSLARITLAANTRDLFLWTMKEPLAVQNGQPEPVPQLSVFSLGSGTPRKTTSAPGPWPVNGEPVAALKTGDIVRLINGRQLQAYAAESAQMIQWDVPILNKPSARPGALTMQVQSNGLIFLADPAIGQAGLLDLHRSFRIVSAISYSPPLFAGGAPEGKVALSSNGEILYTLGGLQFGGVSAYEMSTGALKGTYGQGEQYIGIYVLPNDTVLALRTTSPRLTFLNPMLAPIGTADTDLNVVSVL